MKKIVQLLFFLILVFPATKAMKSKNIVAYKKIDTSTQKDNYCPKYCPFFDTKFFFGCLFGCLSGLGAGSTPFLIEKLIRSYKASQE